MTTKTDDKSKGSWRNLEVAEIKAAFGPEGDKAFGELIAANKVASEKRKALHAIVAGKLPAMPAGKLLITKAQYGKLSIGVVDGEAKATSKPKTSLVDWLAANAA